MPRVMSKKEYLRKKTAPAITQPVQVAEEEVVKASSDVTVSDKPKKIYILQDPDFKTFKDTITLNGEVIQRECQNGMMKTTNENLVKFQMSKGYFLINNEE